MKYIRCPIQESYCFKYYYLYLIQAPFMLILESLLFLHGTSYPSDSLLYSVSKKKHHFYLVSCL